MSVQKIVVLNHYNNEYLHDMSSALVRGFLQEGVDARQVNADESDENIRRKIEKLRPDMVFEINRTRNQSAQLTPEGVLHVAWIQDAWMNSGTGKPKQLHCYDPNFGGSDIIYTMIEPNYFGLGKQFNHGVWGSLYPGIENDIFHPNNEKASPDSAAICGYIPDPPHMVQIKGIALAWNNGQQYLSERMADYLLYQAKISINTHSYPEIHNIMAAEMSRALGCELTGEQFAKPLDKSWLLMYLDTELPRIVDRLAMARAARDAGLDLSIYGPDNWLVWPEFVPNYRSRLTWKVDLAQVYRQTEFNLHNGAFGMHSRVLDCMASGGCIFANDTQDIRQFFRSGEHYVSYETGALPETLAYWRGRHKEIQEIGQNAAAELSSRHTWQHRAQEILGDLESLGQSSPKYTLAEAAKALMA